MSEQQHKERNMPVSDVTTDKNMPNREKDWEELDAPGQIERMRGLLKQLMYDNRRLSKKVQDLSCHQHGLNGDILIPCREGIHGQGGSMQRGNEWF